MRAARVRPGGLVPVQLHGGKIQQARDAGYVVEWLIHEHADG